jgi:hypothetical protein
MWVPALALDRVYAVTVPIQRHAERALKWL